MRKITVSCIVMLVVFQFYACKCSFVGDCSTTTALTKINIFNDGEDAVFGPNPLLAVEDITISDTDNDNVFFQSDQQQLALHMRDGVEYTMELGAIDTIKVIAETAEIPPAPFDCCAQFEAVQIEVDGMGICSLDCTSIDFTLN